MRQTLDEAAANRVRYENKYDRNSAAERLQDGERRIAGYDDHVGMHGQQFTGLLSHDRRIASPCKCLEAHFTVLGPTEVGKPPFVAGQFTIKLLRRPPESDGARFGFGPGG